MRIAILLLGLLCMGQCTQALGDKNTKGKGGNTHHKKWKPGFVVTVNGDTITGKMRDNISPPLYDMQYELAFDDQNSITKHFTPDSLSSFTLYRNHHDQIDTATYVTMNIDDTEIGHAFLRLCINGPCKVYGYTTVVPTGLSSFSTVELKYIRVENGILESPRRIRFKKDMEALFSMCPIIISKLESEDYTFSNWGDMVRDYNRGLCK